MDYPKPPNGARQAPVTVVPVGAVVAYAGPLDDPQAAEDLARQGWMACDGRMLAAQDYPQLFAVLGYAYGGSDNRFVIPDYRGQGPHAPSGVPPVATVANALIRFA